MSLNLLDLLKDQVGGQLAGQASKFLGEDTGAVGKALGGIFPSLLGSVIQKGSDESGANALMDMLSQQDDSILDNISGMFGGGASAVNDLMGGGSNLLSGLLGNKLGGLIDMISSFSGLKSGSTSSLIKMAAPFLMSLLGRQAKSEGMNAGGLMNFLDGQKSFVEKALPSGAGSLLGLSGFDLGDTVSKFKGAGKDVVDAGMGAISGAAGTVGGAGKKIATGAGDVAGKTVDLAGDALDTGKKLGSNLLKWLIPLILILLVLSFFGIRTCTPIDKAADATKGAATGAIEAAEQAAGEVADMASNAAGTVVDASGNVISATADFVNNALKNVNEAALSALDNVKFAAGSAGEKMKSFIDGGAKGDNEFKFGQLTFESGSARISTETAKEIDHIAAILKAYPSINISVEGHTDNTGTAEANERISLARAEAVKNRLIVGGIAAERINTAGFGSSKPIADNSTEAGRIQNRRIVVRIVG